MPRTPKSQEDELAEETVVETSSEPIKPKKIEMTEGELAGLLERTVAEATRKFKESLNDPVPILKHRVKSHVAHLGMYNGKYVVAYKNVQGNPNGAPLYHTREFNPNRSRIEEYVTVVFDDGTELKVNHLDFIGSCQGIKCKIIDVKVVEKTKEYSAIVDPVLSGGSEPKEVILEENRHERTYTLETPEGKMVTLTEDSSGWCPINLTR